MRWNQIFILLVPILGLFGVVNIAWGDTNADVYLFSRNPAHGKLSFITKWATIPGNFSVDNTVCAQKDDFFLPGNPLHSFHVIELADLELQSDIVLSYVPEAAEFVVFDHRRSPTWYFWSNGRTSTLSNASEYESKKANLSHVCYINDNQIPFVSFPDGFALNIMTYVVLGVACIGVFFGTSSMLVYLCMAFKMAGPLHFWQKFTTILSILTTAFCVNAVIGFFAGSSVSSANASLVTSWGSAITIAMMLLYLSVTSKSSSDDDVNEKKDLIHLLVWIILVIIVMILVFLLLAGATGADETSPYTLHSYATPLSRSFDATWKNAITM
jgi:hypothetical protein